MKKFLSILFVIATLLALTACSKFKCDVCREEKSGKKYEVSEFGIELTICDECYN